MSDQTDSNVLAFPGTGLVDPEKKLVEVFERVRTDIASIQSIEEILKLRSQAEALRVYAIQIQCSKETLDQIAEIKVRAERRLGQILALRPEMRGGDRRSVTFQKSIDSTFDSDNSTLQTLGVTKSLSSRSQAIAGISEDQFEQRLKEIKEEGKQPTSSEMLSFAKYLDRERERQERRERAVEEASQVDPDERFRVLCGDFREVLTEDVVPTGSVSLVLTDLPYRREYLDLWDSLGLLSKRILKEGGILAVYSGCIHLPEVLNKLNKHLTYCWTAVVLNESFADTIFHPIRVKSLWKPIVLFSKGHPDPSANENPSHRYLKDVIQGDGLGNLNKQDHPWQQGVGESGYLVEVLSLPGDLVVDPCCGSGTVAVACKRLNRRFIGCPEFSPVRVFVSLTCCFEDQFQCRKCSRKIMS